ncbi:HvfC family RiPP maturation protein [Caedibacter taeniospiralis]|uniref:HvfC family RiPP maturation protein n=1 Tax=Caedibacter taeniospiralis TaxID=28907 RepID=UPI000C276FFD|nr:putative DNA-binding domain-containing protein [Caedibacter taeniospiralis]
MPFEFQATQKSFARRIRHKDRVPLPEGIPLQRMQVYEQSFFNGINELLSNCFPICINALPSKKWHEIVTQFYAEHPCQSPFFYEIPQSFVEFLLHHKMLWQTDYPFLMELAHYEWMEMVIEMAEGEAPSTLMTREIDDNHTIYSVSDVAEIVAYHYPVHQISATFLPEIGDQKPTFFCIYRNSKDAVQSLELNALTARFLQHLKQTPQTLKQALGQVMLIKDKKEVAKVMASNRTLMWNLLNEGVIYPPPALLGKATSPTSLTTPL